VTSTAAEILGLGHRVGFVKSGMFSVVIALSLLVIQFDLLLLLLLLLGWDAGTFFQLVTSRFVTALIVIHVQILFCGTAILLR
jgi:hypothetical protein